MKINVSKILIGISAIIAAGMLSIIPSKSAQASMLPSTENHVFFFNPQSGDIDAFPASITWSYSTPVNENDISHRILEIAVSPTSEYGLVAFNSFNVYAPDSGNVTFSFNFQGNSYSGTVVLNRYSQDALLFEGYLNAFLVPSYGKEFFKGIDTKVNEIDMAFNGLNPDGTVNETKTVEYNYNYAINEKIIEKLAQADGVTLLYTFEYEGYVFTSTITSEDAAKIFSKDIPWYGPCYIASNCPTVMVGVAN